MSSYIISKKNDLNVFSEQCAPKSQSGNNRSCCIFGGMLRKYRKRIEGAIWIPVVEGMEAGFKLAKMREDLNRA